MYCVHDGCLYTPIGVRLRVSIWFLSSCVLWPLAVLCFVLLITEDNIQGKKNKQSLPWIVIQVFWKCIIIKYSFILISFICRLSIKFFTLLMCRNVIFAKQIIHKTETNKKFNLEKYFLYFFVLFLPQITISYWNKNIFLDPTVFF